MTTDIKIPSESTEARRMPTKLRTWKTKVVVLHGHGNDGRNAWAHAHYPNAYVKPPGNNLWNGYDGHEAVIMKDFKGNWMPLHMLYDLFGESPLLVQTEDGFRQFVAKTIVITSNVPPEQWYK
jgi:hypothetical protein